MYDLCELTDLIHGCPGATQPELGPHDPDDPRDAIVIADVVYGMTLDDTPIGRLLASAARADLDLLSLLVVALAGLGCELRDAGHDEVVDAAVLALYAAELPPSLGPWLAGAVSLAD